MAKTLCVRAKGQALVHNFEALEAGILRFVGWRRDSTLGEPVTQADGTVVTPGGWVHTGEPVEVPNRHEYRHALIVGDLEPADEATARAVGLPFTPAEVK